MHLVPFLQAPPYEAPGHRQMSMRRLQGREAGPADSVWIGLSSIEPGGGTTASASDVEKFYVVVEGRLVVEAVHGDQRSTAELGPLDSCRIAPGESRVLRNTSSQPCNVLLVMPLPRMDGPQPPARPS
ncbi:cupin domain-containing protein [Aquincola sp. J276]|uniref:cupin domain-containing protein n=1 Tax=Aquincola sp. J276 TaxID=2898432 RepID=UPI002151B209|nr:cupin domain-containing protein [Aquincola sp. J276]MCR5868179.1 cupin domain-containing protein [Aquincola sp. J276]